jgi:hypothetical protein
LVLLTATNSKAAMSHKRMPSMMASFFLQASSGCD